MRDFCPDMIIVKVNMQYNKDGNEFDVIHIMIEALIIKRIYLFM